MGAIIPLRIVVPAGTFSSCKECEVEGPAVLGFTGYLRLATGYCLNPIQLSDTTSEFPGLCGSYFTEVGSPSRQECRLIHWRR
jgi:hypothetical protein